MKNNELAVLGGSPLISHELANYTSIDSSDIEVATRVLESGNLSRFIGASGDFFLGGKTVVDMESSWSSFFGTRYAVSCNSWTSGLWLAIGSLGLEPGSEVIVSTWTMAATATTLLHWNLVPVFADIDCDTFNIDPEDVIQKINSRTRAIVAPDIFGQSADIERLREICERYDLFLVGDSAQSPGATRNGYLAGTKSDIGGFSLNYHKHIHSGEGGVVVTDSVELATRVQLLRNHGEVVVGQKFAHNPLVGIMGMNMRMGEIEAAIAQNQLTKLKKAVLSRQAAASEFSNYLCDLQGLQLPTIAAGNTHVYYVYGLKLDTQDLQIDRKSIIAALQAEGVPAILTGYQNIHSIPLFREQLTYSENPLPYSLLSRRRRRQLADMELPVSENLHNREFFGINWCAKEFTKDDVSLIGEAFRKVWRNLDALRGM
jgi:dTDP-4-amino-4,6-dideoxygalactose transaminase